MKFKCMLLGLAVFASACSTPTPGDDGRMAAATRIAEQASAPAAAPPSGGSLPCVLLAGGMGGRFKEPKIDAIWMEVNRQVSGYLMDDLWNNGYAVFKYIDDPAATVTNPPASVLALARHGCRQMLQVSHVVGEDGTGRFFGFDIDVLRMVPTGAPKVNGNIPVTVTSDYSKHYRYPRTTAELDTFRTGTFANQVFFDLEAARTLSGAKRGTEVTPMLVRANYERRVDLHGKQEYLVRHILLRTRDQAAAALKRIQQGEAFDKVAQAVSTDAASASRGGDLGWCVPHDFVPTFGDEVRRLGPQGRSAEPVQSPFGWHVVEVLQVRPTKVPDFEAVKGEIERSLRQPARP
jgi:hypothetical protein